MHFNFVCFPCHFYFIYLSPVYKYIWSSSSFTCVEISQKYVQILKFVCQQQMVH